MRRSLSIARIGLSISATLAVLYVVLMLASLILVGRMTTGSWQAFFLGIGWSTLTGFEIGLVATVVVGFVIAAVFVLAYNSLWGRYIGRLEDQARADWPFWWWTRSRRARLLVACLVLPLLVLFGLRGLASFSTLGATSGDAGATKPSPGSQVQPVTMGPVINTAHRDTEPSFTADGRTMYFNCNSDICVSHLIGTWEEGNWTLPERLEAPISTEYEEIEPVINATGDKLSFTSRRPGGRLWRIPFLSPYLDAFRVANTL